MENILGRPINRRQLLRGRLPTRQIAITGPDVRSQQRMAVECFIDGRFPSRSIDLASEFQLNDECRRITGQILRKPQ